MHALMEHLPDFSHALPKLVGAERTKAESGHAPAAAPSAPPQPDLKAIAEAAAAEGRRAGEAAARQAFERQRAEDQARLEERIAAERKSWSEREGDGLARALEAGLAGLERTLCDRLARVVEPFLAPAMRNRALDELAGLIRAAIAAENMPLLRVSGAPDLIDALRARLAADAPVTFEPASGAEVTVTAGATLLETRIAAWLARLGEQEV
ncbi:hypothetical protein [Prosthecomicrobium pneumaticum]|uniref:Flagellar assembly protein FliH/Type III secretion system HrpE domain-containing protein n=1 Tax=Prosthecomicrobium pneumaticum TaxID=81895 RepID=A0A7W9CSV2_9HYPH|nr:hypothetical protein [Prosthecomicrobium pneumaticum]MBB5751014.1 hypothetical protein [Prosthecomicrobium pneumaticum]